MSDSIRFHYLIETPGDPEAMAVKIATDQSTGTFTDLPNETADVKSRCAARVISVEELEPLARPSWPDDHPGPFRRARISIDFPLESIGTDFAALQTIGISALYATRGLSGARLLDIDLPGAYACHPGPQFGIEGSYRMCGRPWPGQAPLIASIIKPSLGLLPEETAGMVRQLCEAGVDFIKDDEKLTSPAYSPFDERVKAIMRVIEAHAEKTGKKVVYAFGLSSADPEEMARRQDVVMAHGGQAAVVNINSIGFGGMTYLRRRTGLALHAHRNGWDLLTRHPAIGMAFRPWQKIWRLLGVDQLQINGIAAKYWEPDESFLQSFRDMAEPIFSESDRALPVCGSGQWGGQAPATFAGTGGALELMYLGGGGIHGHPLGLGAGVSAIRQAWEAAIAGISLQDHAKTHPELAASLAKFGKKAG